MSLNRERVAAEQLDIGELSQDESLIRQVGQSREDRQAGRIYEQEAGLDYLRTLIL
jgi:hypothetical protein